MVPTCGASFRQEMSAAACRRKTPVLVCSKMIARFKWQLFKRLALKAYPAEAGGVPVFQHQMQRSFYKARATGCDDACAFTVAGVILLHIRNLLKISSIENTTPESRPCCTYCSSSQHEIYGRALESGAPAMMPTEISSVTDSEGKDFGVLSPCTDVPHAQDLLVDAVTWPVVSNTCGKCHSQHARLHR